MDVYSSEMIKAAKLRKINKALAEGMGLDDLPGNIIVKLCEDGEIRAIGFRDED